jgi:YidC/Oxa1 family membrane protein insertase
VTQIRWTVFILICVGVLFYFNKQEAERIAAVKKAAAVKVKAQREAAEKEETEKKKAEPKVADKGKGEPGKQGDVKAADAKPAAKPIAPKQPELDVLLGVDEDHGKYRMLATISTKGAVVRDLVLLKDSAGLLRQRFQLLLDGRSYRMDLGDEDLGNQNWEYLKAESQPPSKLVFRTTAKDGAVEIKKTFTLPEGSYLLGFELEFRNLTDKPIEGLTYTLDGPQNLPLEGEWYTQYFRRAASLLAPESGSPYLDEQLAPSVAGPGQGHPLQATAVKYSGVAVQYFASAIVQEDNPLERRLFQSVTPVKLPPAPGTPKEYLSDPNHSNIGVKCDSTPIKIDPKSSVVQKFHLFNGPKEKDLLESAEYKVHGLDKLIVYMGFFGMRFDSMSNGMVWLVNKLAKFTGDYGLAIILLTLIVRIVIFPLSFKQAATMQRATEKMQIIQPKMQEIREKYSNDARKMNQELMELYRKYEYNPASMFGGCLLVFLQMPIFVALYQALQGSFDLRQQPMHFTWIRDLSAPDMLFAFGFKAPWVGPYFNLLPLISLALMMAQMIFAPTPPATTPEMAEQQKLSKRMMMVMMVFIGFMFYNVPAGLCMYIITSTCWGFLERRFIKKSHPPAGTTPVAATSTGSNGSVRKEISWKTPLDKKKKR